MRGFSQKWITQTQGLLNMSQGVTRGHDRQLGIYRANVGWLQPNLKVDRSRRMMPWVMCGKTINSEHDVYIPNG